MRKLTAFIAGFATVLVAGVAVAQLAAPAPDPVPVLSAPAGEPQATVAAKVGESSPKAAGPAATSSTKPAPTPETTTTTKPVAPETTKPVETTTTKPVETTTTKPAPPADTTPPYIEILHPLDGAVFETKEVVFEGHTEPGARVFAAGYEADVNGDGVFRIVLWLSPGANTVTLKAIDPAGNKAVDSVTVTLKVDESAAGFSAFQTYGSCGENPPYDVFYGTGAPGATVEVLSEFGAASTVVGEGGHWEVKVVFPEAPVGKTFPVKVRDSAGNVARFEFTRTG
jgi:hypothetical protein